jgi:hypothetical protein
MIEAGALIKKTNKDTHQQEAWEVLERVLHNAFQDTHRCVLVPFRQREILRLESVQALLRTEEAVA